VTLPEALSDIKQTRCGGKLLENEQSPVTLYVKSPAICHHEELSQRPIEPRPIGRLERTAHCDHATKSRQNSDSKLYKYSPRLQEARI
jgi:hypothetical protein